MRLSRRSSFGPQRPQPVRTAVTDGAEVAPGVSDATQPPGAVATAWLSARLAARELLLGRVAWVAGVVAASGLGLALLAGHAAVRAQGRLVADFTLASMQLAVDGVALAATVGGAAEAGVGGASTTWLARPVGRTSWLLGQWAGLVAVLAASVAGMAAAGAGNAALCGAELPHSYVAAAAMTVVEGGVLAALGTLLSRFVAPPLAATAAVVLLAAGHLGEASAGLGGNGGGSVATWGGAVARAALPDFARLSLRGWVAADVAVPHAAWAAGGAYGLGYACCALGLAAWVQARRLGS